jgi:hypothetical protein
MISSSGNAQLACRIFVQLSVAELIVDYRDVPSIKHAVESHQARVQLLNPLNARKLANRPYVPDKAAQLPDRNRDIDRYHGARITAPHHPYAEATACEPELPLGMVILEATSPSPRRASALSKTRREVEVQTTATVVLVSEA